MRNRDPKRVSDLIGGELIKAGDGHFWRIGQMKRVQPEGTTRWARMCVRALGPGDEVAFLETKTIAYLPPLLPVLEVVQEARTLDTKGERHGR